ncbi:MAG: hypothetical protein J6386_03660 [Candidatus Synoicihabitans palmerolidicus]|nr:hypothetical protein [Candidatus Synoicihabitans palmerolidicus]
MKPDFDFLGRLTSITPSNRAPAGGLWRPFRSIVVLATGWVVGVGATESPAPIPEAIAVIREHLHQDYSGMLREEGGAFEFPFLTPGSEQYPDILWDWDSWLSNVALRQVLAETATTKGKAHVLRYEQGCVLNYLNYGGSMAGLMDGSRSCCCVDSVRAKNSWLRLTRSRRTCTNRVLRSTRRF